MIKRVLYTSILAAQLLTISAMRTEASLRPLDCKAGSQQVALTRADDPIPCPECAAGTGNGPVRVRNATRQRQGA